jgi:hypothetical protein
MTGSLASWDILSNVFFCLYAKTDLEVPGKGFHEVARLEAQDRLVAIVLACLAVVDLIDLHV